MAFDWTAIVTRNRADLARLVVMIAAMVGGGGRVSRAVWLGVLQMLRPAESALRRLIFIAARGLEVRPGARGMPEGGIAPGVGARLRPFALFDARRQVGLQAFGSAAPRIRSFDEPPGAAQMAAPDVDAGALLRRLDRMKRALERLPAEAKRLARWRQRHPASVKRPMRPGRPPGFRQDAGSEIAQMMLRDLQELALWADVPEKAG